MNKLPIQSILPELKSILKGCASAVLVAEPGAGKTTVVPLALLSEQWLKGRRILMLEPRRLAARAAARYMAASLQQQIGQTIGYRVRLDARVGPDTRIEVITEGILTRMLQSDPSLTDVGLVIFDEFHERSIHADLGLAFCLQSQAILRPDLRILVMSATLDVGPVSALLGDAPVISGRGRCFPIVTHYLDHPLSEPIEYAVVRSVLHALQQERGDILVFLPGTGEIRRVEKQLNHANLPEHVVISPLYGNLPQAAQEKAIAPSLPSRRKVVLATAIAQTSLTVEGVRIVIDSGLMRIARFSPRTGMTRLETVPVSRAAADQRRGRAGRLERGVCYRLWTPQQDLRLQEHTAAEILAADLASLALELAAWGVRDPKDLLWLDPPPRAALAQARELLVQLGAIDEDGNITRHGQYMVQSGLHPRLAHMILKAISAGLGSLACQLAAILTERDLLWRCNGVTDADLCLRIDLLHKCRETKQSEELMLTGVPAVQAAGCRRVLAAAEAWQRQFGISYSENDDTSACGLLLAFAYPDRIAQRRNNGKYILRNGRGAFFVGEQILAGEAYLVAAELDDQGTESRIFLAAPVEMNDLMRHFAEQVEEESVVAWDKQVQAVRAKKITRLGSLVLNEASLPTDDPQQCLAVLLDGIAGEGLRILPWTREAAAFRQRLNFMHNQDGAWPDVSDEALTANLSEWLGPFIYGIQSREHLARLNLAQIFQAMLTWEQSRQLDEYAPAFFRVPSGRRIPIDYSDADNPVLAVRLQEMFGLEETPRIARGKVNLILHLLSPAHRPVQVTRDLASFWRSTYFEVRKDLMGRYPKHYWPDDPLVAIPTHCVRPKSR